MISLFGLGFLYLFCLSCYKAIFYYFSAKLVSAERYNISLCLSVSIYSTFISTFLSYFLVYLYIVPDINSMSIAVFFIIDILICLFFFNIKLYKGIAVSFLSTFMCIISSFAIVYVLSHIEYFSSTNTMHYFQPIIVGLMRYLEAFNIDLLTEESIISSIDIISN